MAELVAYAKCKNIQYYYSLEWKFLWHRLQRLNSIATTCLSSSKYVLPLSINAFECFTTVRCNEQCQRKQKESRRRKKNWHTFQGKLKQSNRCSFLYVDFSSASLSIHRMNRTNQQTNERTNKRPEWKNWAVHSKNWILQMENHCLWKFIKCPRGNKARLNRFRHTSFLRFVK